MAQGGAVMASQAYANDDQRPVKRRAACDECRTKKLKCTGEQPSCSRCVREGISCVYSPQKQMGRPKKRSRPENELDLIIANKRSSTLQSTTDSLGGYDMDAFEGAFTPGGNLQPWLQSGGDWNAGDTFLGEGFEGDGGNENGVPALTPDNSATQSPPMLNLPPELQNGLTQSQHQQRDNSTHILLDPALVGSLPDGADPSMHSSILPNCACLSTMYLTLNTLQTLPEKQAAMFPYALHPLREAMETASQVLSCEECPKRFITAIHNTQLIGTLLMSISERFSKVLQSITAESIRAEAAGEKKKFRLQDLNTSTSHLHTGGLGCVAAFSLNLSPEEWRGMCKKVVRAEVHGPEDGNECCVYLMGIFKQMEDRQERWHSKPPPEDFPRDHSEGGNGALLGRPMKKEDHVCLKLVAYARKLAEGFDWS